MFTRYFSLSTLSLTLLASSYVMAATLPDAGQSLRELQNPLQPKNTPLTAPALHIEGPATASPSKSQTPIPVERFTITGNTLFPESALLPLLSDLTGAKHTLAELEASALRISQYYHDHGYPVARAYLPAQDIQNGMVTIAVLEGHIDQVKINNQSRISDTRANDYLGEIQHNAVIQSVPIDRALLLLSDTPGIGEARATLQPGASVGSSDLLIDLKPSAPISGQMALDNYGNRYTGQIRFTEALTLNSPFKLGDQLSLNIVASESQLGYGRLAWQAPIGHQGLTLGAAYAGTHYRLGQEFSNLNAFGSATIGSLIATYPFLRTPNTNLSGTFSWEDKHLLDHIDSTIPATRSNKNLKQFNLGLVGNHQDTLGGESITYADATLSHGRLSFDADSDSATLNADAVAQTQGDYSRFSYNLNRLQRLNNRNSLTLRISGQFADKNLSSSEKFALGGTNGVRAFAEGEASGDEGWISSLAWNYALCDFAQSSVFYDTGSTKINHTAFNNDENRRTLSGIGFGLNITLPKVLLKAAIAWRTEGESKSSPDHLPRLWLQAAVPF